MNEDLVRRAMENAARSYGEGKLFNAAGFSQEFTRLAGVSTQLDGHIVRAILSGRPDVIHLPGGAHFLLRVQ
jgi:hypothetical protein